MEVSKLKNIVIVILVLLNLFLLVLSGGRRVQDARDRDEARSAAVEVIRNGGVVLEEQIVPAEMDLLPLTADRDLQEELRQARTLLGGEVEMQAKGGEVYRYSNASGWLQVHSTGQYSAEVMPQTPLTQEDRLADRAVAELAKLDIQSVVVESRMIDGRETVILNQSLDGVPLLGCQVTVVCTDGGSLSFTAGRRLLGETQRAEGTPITVATALMRLYNGLNDLGDVYSTIQTITPAYLLSTEGGGSVRLTPVWQVETDTGIYRLDTLTGVLTRTGDFGRQTVQEIAE